MKSVLNQIQNNLVLWIGASLTLGLAPFNPPHIWGKIQWILGGAVGMKAVDWGDFIMHGAPWIMLIIALLLRLRKKEVEN
ncbi:MAG: hypothetical protein ACI857_001763 [Arenicella sp.]|jgi:hypothetical protein